MTQLHIRKDDLSGEAVRALVALHLADMHANSPPDHVHALPVDSLRARDVTVYSAWHGDALVGIGAIRQLTTDHGELKSMRVAPAVVRQGAGEAILRHLLSEARDRGYTRVSLETGRGAAFEPALGLYRKYGFVACPGFADYVPGGFSQCLTLELG